MTRDEKIKKSGTAETARLLKPLYCSNCCRYVRKECPSTNRDNSCWAVILDWLTREERHDEPLQLVDA